MSQLLMGFLEINYHVIWLICAVLAVRLLLRKTSKKTICALWMLVGLRLVLPFSIESNFSLVPAPDWKSTDMEQIAETAIPIDKDIMESGGVVVPQDPETGDTILPGLTLADGTQVSPSHNDLNGNEDSQAGTFEKVARIVVIVWLLGVAGMLGYFVISTLRLRRVLATAVSRQVEIANDGDGKAVTVWQSEWVDSPFILGLVKPRIYIPFHMEEGTLQQVLAHEQMHLKRRDHWTKAIGFWLICIYWVNPLVWLSYYLLCKDMEMACDEQVVSTMDGEQRKEYSRALLSCQGKKSWYYTCPVGFGELNVKERIRRIKQFKKPTFWVSLVAVLLCIVVAVGFFTQNREISGAIDTEQTGTETDGAGEGTPNPTPVSLETDTAESLLRYDLGDMDGNGTREYCDVELFPIDSDCQSRITLVWNEEVIYTYEKMYNNLLGPRAEYLDLDGDGAEEIFFRFEPNVNSRPLMEYIVLKQKSSGWEPLEMIHGEEMADNAFPISVEAAPDNQMLIRCEGTEDGAAYDYTAHFAYLRMELDNANFADEERKRLDSILKGTEYDIGDTVAVTAPWGIWEIESGKGAMGNYLVATHGLEDLFNQPFGRVKVYFNYNTAGKVNILKLEYVANSYPLIITGIGEKKFSGDGIIFPAGSVTAVTSELPGYGEIILEPRDFREQWATVWQQLRKIEVADGKGPYIPFDGAQLRITYTGDKEYDIQLNTREDNQSVYMSIYADETLYSDEIIAPELAKLVREATNWKEFDLRQLEEVETMEVDYNGETTIFSADQTKEILRKMMKSGKVIQPSKCPYGVIHIRMMKGTEVLYQARPAGDSCTGIGIESRYFDVDAEALQAIYDAIGCDMSVG